MKLQLLSILVIMLMVIPTVNVLATDNGELQISVEEIHEPSTIHLGITLVITSVGAHDVVVIEVIAEDEIIQAFHLRASAQGEVIVPWLVSKDTEPGFYTFKISDAFDSAEITFEYINDDFIEPELPIIQIFTDKTHHYELDTIQITGKINELTISPTDTIGITLHDKNDSTLIRESLIPITNNTFSHDIITEGGIWDDHFGDVKITAQIQGYTEQITVHYSPYPQEISLEFLHDIISDNADTINSMSIEITTIQEQNTQFESLVTSLTNSLISLQSQVNTLEFILEELTGEPVLSNAPIITSIHLDDKDMDNTYSVGDTITITFDSDTNTPGGVIQTKASVDNMFTFTESLGQPYRGQWIGEDTFVITIKGLRDAGPPLVGITTVFPTGITEILSADETSLPSNSTSPVLTGDFG